MNRSSATDTAGAGGIAGYETARYNGVRRRSWGKWVSEIRVPGTGERLWLGSYAAPEAAAAAHDDAVFFLRGPGWSRGLNFPDWVARFTWASLSPRSVQKVASEWGMTVDAELVEARQRRPEAAAAPLPEAEVAAWGDISVGDMEICMYERVYTIKCLATKILEEVKEVNCEVKEVFRSS